MLQISSCFNEKLLEICKQAHNVEIVQKEIFQLLPSPFHQYVRVGSFNQGSLILQTNDAVWASQLRFLLPDIRDQLRKINGFQHLRAIKLIIAPELQEKTEKRKSTPALTNKTKELLLDAAKECEYAPLKKALENLAGS
ncbi:Zn-ribbon-containing, possible RNA-binding protein-like protein (plasmid) [Legionella adelaidensis]|uniref:Zn-ribbon-containing, possible RNA-binding protein-like protein n=1 Tax=Legionella adelaidensis TaxID=45056 RepID=A0A0W0R5T8_9GAMM|nr:DciA family protein [Legionella adelaidensis]KTC66424.1 hypothetical protein Lade_1082 [Legionella adelaidensis]VEH85022.1 Zn-ribbon-containing, possible RNA-binding protein-like protein [Legionella adelaidensis]